MTGQLSVLCFLITLLSAVLKPGQSCVLWFCFLLYLYAKAETCQLPLALQKRKKEHDVGQLTDLFKDRDKERLTFQVLTL
jgi:hypothetical protein